MIRPALPCDAPALTALLNAIIAIGGTTAHQNAFSDEVFCEEYIAGPNVVCCHLAIDAGQVLGFQALGAHALLPKGWLDIGTFVSATARGAGVGAALFAATKTMAKGKCKVINATIRADNAMGLAFYNRIGFVDYAVDPEFALNDGRKVGRVSKRYALV